MRIMGLDVGSKTVGVAVSDALGWTAQGIETVKIDEANGEFGIDRIAELVKEYAITEFVVGFPKNMNNTVGPRGEASENYKKLLEETFSLPVKLWDERLTTMAAERMLIEADVSRKKRKQVIDKMAAVMILQGYLDSKN
ncbi:Holliday junction resolvase RuvX [Lysinibacillus sp. FSL R7-0073]|jgi:putative holliday junction resolvase|uniref:Putative pre-16S rRNA nuclease n=1 Tax=Lysinibacillus fusiformis TaxID=28031 RepID=A0A1E4R9N4_9BACI|nr:MULTISPECIES: Holliday junction resolvase RuvX [Lysinibacillus]HBJ01775.1 Holliday junction resolvase RuvX [Lysinibacillus sp.]MBD8522160.1 Holliday junction resolvase RuvX [Lysinibacillus fusiformis]MCR8853006.1 Holliday junction resolvase RuvX [Lysinibacillus fusiformis]MED4888885.1 Holliday junction resolvase RuvX [Lysinibacillus fusiformis]ODV57176.1 Holliday junction DNA helicase RuvA [Lysinibacillus fusiformis]